MKRKAFVLLLLSLVFVLALAISVGAECAEHTYDYEIKLGSNGFLGDIIAEGKCSACGATTNETIPSIFITKGYSYSKGGIAQGYGVDRQALKRYEELSGEKVRFGGVLAVRSVIGNVNPLNDDATPAHSSVQVLDLTDTKYSIINIMVKGIPEGMYESEGILCAMYVEAGGFITYIDNRAEKAVCSDKTYNEVVANPEPDSSELSDYTIIDGKRYYQFTNEDFKWTQAWFWNGNRLQQNGSDTAFNNKFWGTGVSYTKNDLPNGTIITLDSSTDGWQYRPHKYASGVNTRPDNTKEARVVINDAWWGPYTNVGFNLGIYKGTGATQKPEEQSDASGYEVEDILKVFKIFVPVNAQNVEELPSQPEPNPDYSNQKQDWDEDNTLKILAIGNSFSVDSMEYIYQVAQSAGIENVVLGNLYIPGCPLSTHLSNAQTNSGAYTYYTNSTGTWSSSGGVSIKTAVESDDWDFISIQQVSGQSGISSSYSTLDALIDIVEPLNPSARIVWHMTWAYKQSSDHQDFPSYNRDQMTMYNAILEAVEDNILTENRIEIVIPAGTAIQNTRTSYIGDNLTRDGYHLNDYGRFIGSLSYVKALTGVSIDNVTYKPSGVSDGQLAVAIEAVNNAYAKPFEVTNSTYTTEPDQEEDGDDNNESGSTITPPAVPEGYIWLTLEQMGLVESQFYQSDASSGWYNPTVATNTFGQGFMSTKKFSKSELPVGTIIVIAQGWQYRPEGWVNGGKNSSSARPANVTTQRVVIDEAWWGSFTERAFNISKITNTTSNPDPITITKEELANTVFFIYVPEDYVPENPPVQEPESKVYISSDKCDSEIVTIDGKEYRALKASVMGYQQRAYYFSSNKGPEIHSSTDDTSKDFWATKVFTSEDIPVGSIIWVDSKWQYRPEFWKNGAKNPNRPLNVTTEYVEIMDEWWANCTERAFNLSMTDGTDIGTDPNLTADGVHQHFKIYIPVENIVEEVAQ